MMPKRIQRMRNKGWRMPKGAVYVGRPSRWGNPFRVSNGDCEHPDCGPKSHPPINRQMAVNAYRGWLVGMIKVDPEFVDELRGKNLACWCAPNQVCHADVLLEIANRENRMCQKPDRDCPRMKCGYPLPCPYHTDVVIDGGPAKFLRSIHGSNRRAIEEIAKALKS